MNAIGIIQKGWLSRMSSMVVSFGFNGQTGADLSLSSATYGTILEGALWDSRPASRRSIPIHKGAFSFGTANLGDITNIFNIAFLEGRRCS